MKREFYFVEFDMQGRSVTWLACIHPFEQTIEPKRKKVPYKAADICITRVDGSAAYFTSINNIISISTN